MMVLNLFRAAEAAWDILYRGEQFNNNIVTLGDLIDDHYNNKEEFFEIDLHDNVFVIGAKHNNDSESLQVSLFYYDASLKNIKEILLLTTEHRLRSYVYKLKQKEDEKTNSITITDEIRRDLRTLLSYCSHTVSQVIGENFTKKHVITSDLFKQLFKTALQERLQEATIPFDKKGKLLPADSFDPSPKDQGVNIIGYLSIFDLTTRQRRKSRLFNLRGDILSGKKLIATPVWPTYQTVPFNRPMPTKLSKLTMPITVTPYIKGSKLEDIPQEYFHSQSPRTEKTLQEFEQAYKNNNATGVELSFDNNLIQFNTKTTSPYETEVYIHIFNEKSQEAHSMRFLTSDEMFLYRCKEVIDYPDQSCQISIDDQYEQSIHRTLTALYPQSAALQIANQYKQKKTVTPADFAQTAEPAIKSCYKTAQDPLALILTINVKMLRTYIDSLIMFNLIVNTNNVVYYTLHDMKSKVTLKSRMFRIGYDGTTKQIERSVLWPPAEQAFGVDIVTIPESIEGQASEDKTPKLIELPVEHPEKPSPPPVKPIVPSATHPVKTGKPFGESKVTQKSISDFVASYKSLDTPIVEVVVSGGLFEIYPKSGSDDVEIICHSFEEKTKNYWEEKMFTASDFIDQYTEDMSKKPEFKVSERFLSCKDKYMTKVREVFVENLAGSIEYDLLKQDMVSPSSFIDKCKNVRDTALIQCKNSIASRRIARFEQKLQSKDPKPLEEYNVIIYFIVTNFTTKKAYRSRLFRFQSHPPEAKELALLELWPTRDQMAFNSQSTKCDFEGPKIAGLTEDSVPKTTPGSADVKTPEGKEPSKGMVIGLVVAGAVVLILCFVVAIYFLIKGKRSSLDTAV